LADLLADVRGGDESVLMILAEFSRTGESGAIRNDAAT
jgi:hypothetical protein